MRTIAQELGAEAEDLVVARLRRLGWTILGRNVHVGRAEIDILAIDPGPATPELVVAEVRWRRRRDYGLPEETVDHAKLARLRTAVLTLREGAPLTGIPVPRLPVRVDVVAVEPGGVVRHHRAVG
jgi:putative endonuclease